MSLSVIIITYNEERNIERCLKSVLGIADEILIVDSYSTDQTLSICERYNARIIKRKFEGYGNQKQFASSQASFDYVLSLDADEELSNELIKSILNIKNNWLFDCYSFNRKNFYCNKFIRFCGWYPDKQIRLYNKNKINWNSKIVHETIEFKKTHRLQQLQGDLNHYTCTTIAEHEAKERKYAKMNAEILLKNGKTSSFVTPYIKGAFRFIKTYIFKLGILDGYYGFVISKTLAKSSFYKYYLTKSNKK